MPQEPLGPVQGGNWVFLKESLGQKGDVTRGCHPTPMRCPVPSSMLGKGLGGIPPSRLLSLSQSQPK